MVAFPVKKRIRLALSGGATRGLAHIGVLKALEDHHIRPDCLSGSSIGAFAAAFYAFGVPIKEMRRVG
jgi:NTE family protein